MKSLGVIGAGAWGTALAQVGARAGLSVRLWAHEAEVAATLAATRENSAYLPGVRLEGGVEPTCDPADLGGADLVLAACPAQHMRATLSAFVPHLSATAPIVLCAKGVEQGSLRLMSEVAAEVLPANSMAVLSGPSFAAEVARGLPCAVTLACADLALGEAIARAIALPSFRPYVADDVVGAEAGGAVKNVLAIACGVVEGRGLGRSAHAGLITRGFAEMTRLGVALGARAETMAGLCGLGDLVLTCSSPQSRNMSLGIALGRGETLEQALAGKRSVVEGLSSAPAVVALARRLGVEVPICEAVARVAAGETGVEAAIDSLLSRPLKLERATHGAGPLMPLFLILCTDKPGSRELRAATRPDHLAYLSQGQVQVRVGGAWLDETDDGPLGSMLVVEADDVAAARAFAAADPYARAGLFASVEIRPWRLAVGAFG